MKQCVKGRVFDLLTLLCRPVRIDLGVVAVLAHVVIKVWPAGRKSRHDEVEPMRVAVGERNRGPLIGIEQFQHRGRQ